MNPKQALKENTILANPDSNEEYIIKKLIATGGFSFVYEAEMVLYTHSVLIGKREISREVVVLKELFYPEKAKRLHDSTQVQWEDESNPNALSKKIKSKTLSEASKLSSLQSKYILHIYSVFELNNTVYIATKQVKNATDFNNYLSLENIPKKLSVADSLGYFSQICEALREVHEKNIVHLDIKPDNILIDNNGDTTLIDFGISVTLKEGKAVTLIGAVTPHYAPPEQASGKRINFSTDIYALGCTLYVFLTGKLVPNYSDRIDESVIAPSFYNAEVSSYLEEVIFKAINLNMSDRYQTVDHFLDAVNGEEHYNKIIKQANTEFSNKQYETAIKTLDKATEFIPATEEVQNLLASIRSEFQMVSEKEEFDRKVSQIDLHLEKEDFQLALDILKTLTPSDEIENKIKLAEDGERKKTIVNLRKKAQARQDANELQEAITLYQEIKILSPKDNEELNGIINNLIDEKNYQNHLLLGEQYLEKQSFDTALQEFNIALKIKPANLELTEKIEHCQSQIIQKQKYETALEKVNSFEVLTSLTDNQLFELKEIAQAYKKEEYFQEVYEQKKDQNFRDKATSEFQNQNYSESAKLFRQIQDKTNSDSNYILEIANYIDIQAVKELIKNENYNDAIDLLQRVGKNSPFFDESAEILHQAYYLQAKVHHSAKSLKVAADFFNKIPEEAKQYTDAQQFLHFYKGQSEFEKNEFTNASSTFNEITLDDLKDAVSDYQSKIKEKKEKTTFLDQILIRDAKEEMQKENWDKALSILEKIKRDSLYYPEAQKVVKEIEEKEGELKNLQNLKKAEEKIKQNLILDAKELLSSISQHSKSYPEAQQLLETITKKSISIGRIIAVAAILILIAVAWLAILSKEETPTETTEVTVLNEETLDSTAVEVPIISEAEKPIEQTQEISESKKSEPETIKQINTKLDEEKRKKDQRVEKDRIEKEIELKRVEEANKAEYNKELNWARGMVNKFGMVKCKENDICKGDVIQSLQKAIRMYPKGEEAKILLRQIQY